MMVPRTPSGDADRDYARMMVGHHQSAVQMALAEVDLGKGTAVKQPAQGLVMTRKKKSTSSSLAPAARVRVRQTLARA